MGDTIVYFSRGDGRVSGRYPFADAIAMVIEGKIPTNHYYWFSGMYEWDLVANSDAAKGIDHSAKHGLLRGLKIGVKLALATVNPWLVIGNEIYQTVKGSTSDHPDMPPPPGSKNAGV
jgi:hypothetical protein